MCKILPKESRWQALTDWINQETEGNEGYTALHFASFHGNLSIIRFLESHGADIYAVNRNNLNMLHVAAQGNQPPSIVYFLDRGFEVNSRDNVNSTPLHWACFSGSGAAVAYLVANEAKVNA